jgi:signal transduction histidine kinase
VRDISASFSAASTLEEIGDTLETWVSRLVDPCARARTWIWDGPGLRVISDFTCDDETEAAVRRAVWLEAAPHVVLAASGRIHLLLPLGHEAGQGVLEVEGASQEVDDARPALDVLAAIAGAAVARTGETAMRIDGLALDTGEDSLEGALAWASHELRAPMVATKLALGQIIDEGDLEPGLAELLRRSAETLDRFTGDIEQILSWASTSATGALRRDPLDLSLLVADVIDSVREPREGDRVVTALDDCVVVVGDEVQLRSAITNLIRNALQHSPPGSAVDVSMVVRAGEAVLAVTNAGTAPPSERSEIFGRFARGRAGGYRGSGSGLGLFVADRVARAHGGRIFVESTGNDVRFTLCLRSDS